MRRLRWLAACGLFALAASTADAAKPNARNHPKSETCKERCERRLDDCSAFCVKHATKAAEDCKAACLKELPKCLDKCETGRANDAARRQP